MPAPLPPLAQVAKEAGDVILAMRPDVIHNKRWIIKSDGSPETIADIKANEIVCEGLRRHFPGMPVVSEENHVEDNARALQASERIDTDPLDNTNNYIEGWEGFSVNIGRIKDGVPIAGVIYFPARQELYFTSDDGKAYLQQGNEPPREIRVKRLPLRTPLQVAVGFNEQNIDHLAGREFEAKKYPAQLRTCMVARGECDITGINKGAGGFNSWDTAGPHAVLLAAGGDIVGTDGKLMRYPPGVIKLPSHIAGAKDVLIALGLAGSEIAQSGQRRA